MGDLYEILGVERNATQDQIKSAYRKKAIEHHPDKGGDAEKFKEVSQAYEILSDQNKRQNYDRFGSAEGNPFGGNGINIEDIFGDIFGGFSGFGNRERVKRGQDMRVKVSLTLEEILFGVNKKINYTKQDKCNTCSGKGGTNLQNCVSCNGVGYRSMVQNTPFGTISQNIVCHTCEGSGKIIVDKCNSCKGSGTVIKNEQVDVNFPPGVMNGMQLTMEGFGGYTKNSVAGDLYLQIEEIPDPKFKRVNNDLHYDEYVSIPDAILGTKLNISTPHGNINLNVNPGCESGKIFTYKGKGVPNLAQNGRTYGSGDLHVKVNVKIPTKLTSEEKNIINNLKTKQNFQ